MFGIGAQEMMIVGLLALVVFGPGKLPAVARDLGSFVRKARRSMDELKGEIAFEENRRYHRRRSLREGYSEEDEEAGHRGRESGGKPGGERRVAQGRGVEEPR